jgi:hypothetical protein
MVAAACAYLPTVTKSSAEHSSASGEGGIEALPDDVLRNILGRLRDTRSLAHFAMASRGCRGAAARADLVRHVTMPVQDTRRVLHPANVLHAELATPPGFTHCVQCFFCKCLIPVPLAAIVIDHKCDDRSYKFPIWTTWNVVLYRGPTHHLPRPMPCSAERLKMYNVPLPSVYPYAAPLLA